MRKYFALFLALFLCFSTTVSAAPNNNWLVHSNQYSYSVGGGTFEYVIPYTGYYDISLGGSQGSAYNSNSGGKGYVLGKKVYLTKGDVIKVVIGRRPAWSQSGALLTVPGGNYSELYLNGTLQWRAAGGAATQSHNIAPTGVTSVQYLSGNPTSASAVTLVPHWHTGNGKSGPTHNNAFPTVYSTTYVGGCYGWSGHTHDATGACRWEYAYHEHRGCSSKAYSQCGSGSCPMCGHTLQQWTGDHLGNGNEGYGGNSEGGNAVFGCPSGCKQWTCGNSPKNAGKTYLCGNYNNTQTIKCGYAHGEIRGSIPTIAGTCYAIPEGEFKNPSASIAQSGDGVFRCSLSTQGKVISTMYGEHPIAYKGTKVELLLVDEENEDKDYVAYFRR